MSEPDAFANQCPTNGKIGTFKAQKCLAGTLLT
jgi:hypothetical protein